MEGASVATRLKAALAPAPGHKMLTCCLGVQPATAEEVSVPSTASRQISLESAGKAVESNAPARFTMRLQKTSPREQFGWRVDVMHGEAMFIGGVLDEGLVHRYNESAPEEAKVLADDYVVAVNGVSGSSVAIGEELKKAQVLDLTIQRPRRVSASCRRGGKELRMDLKQYPSGRGVLIHAIGEGVARAQMPELQVGDRIVRVNDATGASTALIEALGGDELALEVLRVD